jgi:hypothetical protein
VSALYEDLARAPLSAHWKRYIVGSAALERAAGGLRFVNVDTTTRRGANAQIDDYERLRRQDYLWRPPLTMTVRARFSHPAAAHGLSGTAGFGFWNDPFMMTGRLSLALPRAIWFFYASPPSNMKLDLDAPGWGWKAATIDALRWPALLLAPLAPAAMLLMNVRALYRALWPPIQRAIRVSEASLAADMTAWHTYALEWGTHSAHFAVDGETVLRCDTPPRGPLGFVMWLDNQYMVATPWGKFRYGRLAAPGRQWMEVESLSIVPARGGSTP